MGSMCSLRLPLVAFTLLVVGCPSSDDALLLPDAGLSAMDILVDLKKDSGKQEPDITTTPDVDKKPEDTAAGCKTDGDCASAEIDLKPCEIPVCQPATGLCVPAGKPDGSPCDDGDACTVTECKSSACVVKDQVLCDDANPCTADSCKKDTGCHFIAQTGTPCDDGDECTENDVCKDGACFPGQVVCQLGSVENPANSCKHIKDISAGAQSGVFVLKNQAGDGTIEVYCDMDIAGGGWARIAVIRAEIPICSFGEIYGQPADVLGNPATSAWWPPEVVATVPTETNELMVSVGKDAFLYKSSHKDWSWSNVANGVINLSNSGDYLVQGAIAGSDYKALKNVKSPGAFGPQLLSGHLGATSKLGPILGIGAWDTKTFKQDANCTSKSKAYPGLYNGQFFTAAASWGQQGAIYIK